MAFRRGGRMLTEDLSQFVGEHRGALGAPAAENHAELLPAESADDIAGPDIRAEDVRHVQQHLVANESSVALVYLVKALEVEDDERQRPAMALAVVHRIVELRHQRGCVEETGQLVPVKELAETPPPLGS